MNTGRSWRSVLGELYSQENAKQADADELKMIYEEFLCVCEGETFDEEVRDA
jgi:hypothetical protein